MNINVRDFLGYSYNHGYIQIRNNKDLGKMLWEGKFETIDHQIPNDVINLKVIKWGIENNGIVIYVNYEESEEN